MSSSEISVVISELSKIEQKTDVSIFNKKYEKRLFMAMIAIFVLIAITGITFHFSGIKVLELVIILLMLFFYAVAIIWQIFSFIPIVKFFKNPTANLLSAVEASASKEVLTMRGLSDISVETLEYLSKRFSLAKDQLSQRMSYLMGAVEKVGVLPGVIASVLALKEFFGSQSLSDEHRYWFFTAAICFSILYLFSLIAMLVSQRFEVYSGVLKHHLEFRKADNQ